MCGFGGVINYKENISPQQIAAVAGGVKFRGPDSCGTRVYNQHFERDASGNTAVFFNRLAIIDLDSRSDQPFEDDEHLLTFNGEIYNYIDLKKRLETEGVSFRTTSDTEVLFFALKRWGTRTFDLLNGMFSFFWLNKSTGQFIAARDRLGIKPLYYRFEKGTFYFSSELHSILRMMKAVPPVSRKAVDMFLWMQFVPAPHTIFEGINKLPPGSFVSGNAREHKVEPKVVAYWDVYKFTQSSTQKSDPSHLEDILRDSVHRQLQADVPIGLFLSSGTDSSLLAAIVNKYFASQQDVNFFTVSFGEKTATDESADAIDFIKGFRNPKLINHLLEINPLFMQQQVNDLYRYYDEPFGDYASLLNWAISAKAREYVTVAISGDGADELFWGYERYNKWQELTRLNKYPLVSETVSTTARLLPSSTFKTKLQGAFEHDAVARHFNQFLMPAFRPLLDKSIIKQPMWATEHVDLVKERSDLPGILDIKTYLADAMLYKVDRSSMATSLEVRVPYLDNEVIEFALQLGLNEKSNQQFQNKAILKNLLIKLAPHYNANRPKKGFSFPLRSWLKQQWKEQVRSSITPAALADMGLEPKSYMHIVNDFYNNNSNAQVEVWYLFNLVLWKRQIDQIRSGSVL